MSSLTQPTLTERTIEFYSSDLLRQASHLWHGQNANGEPIARPGFADNVAEFMSAVNDEVARGIALGFVDAPSRHRARLVAQLTDALLVHVALSTVRGAS